jgi:hypothetical protein
MFPKRPKLVKGSPLPSNMDGQESSTSYTPMYSDTAGLPSFYENPIKVPRPVPTYL